MLKGSGMRMGGGAQQFGVDAERVPQLIGLLDAAGLSFEGFHIFAGSQNLRAEIISEVPRQTVDLALGTPERTGTTLRYLNLGRGFGIPSFTKDDPPALPKVVDHPAPHGGAVSVSLAAGEGVVQL